MLLSLISLYSLITVRPIASVPACLASSSERCDDHLDSKIRAVTVRPYRASSAFDVGLLYSVPTLAEMRDWTRLVPRHALTTPCRLPPYGSWSWLARSHLTTYISNPKVPTLHRGTPFQPPLRLKWSLSLVSSCYSLWLSLADARIIG